VYQLVALSFLSVLIYWVEREAGLDTGGIEEADCAQDGT